MTTLSVIMTTYNENPGFLKSCIDSVLQQTFNNFEFIMVLEPGDKNLDFLEEKAAGDNRIKILKNNSRLGISASRNRAIQEGRGSYIAIIDGDDYCDLSRFEKQIRFLEDNPEISLVGSNMYLVNEDSEITGERKYPEQHDGIKNKFLFTMPVANPTLMVRKKDFEEIGFFDKGFSKSEDFELWLRFLAGNKKMHNLQDNLLYYRIPAGHAEKRGRVHWLNNYVARKRHSRYIWPLHKRLISLFLYFVISRIPEIFLDRLLGLKIVRKIKKVQVR